MINYGFPETNSEEIKIDAGSKIVYIQEPDCCQPQDSDYQNLTLEADDGGGGMFIRFKTGPLGWSVDTENLQNLINIFNDFRMKMEGKPCKLTNNEAK